MAELPQNWQKEYLTDICNVYQPKTISTKELLADGSYPVYGANGQIGYYDKYNHEFSEVLITCRGATCGNINKSVPKSWINGNAMVASPISNAILDKNYLFYYLKNTSFDDYISGTAQPQITRTSLTKMPVIYPPLNEQKRIVEKLDKIIRIVDGVNARLDKIPTALKRARQSILNQAITGELTKDWREIHHNCNHADDLIRDIQDNRKKQYEVDCKKAKFTGNKTPKKLFLPEYKHLISSVQNWGKCYLANIFSVETGSTPLRSNDLYYKDGNIPWIKTGEVQNCEIYRAEEYITEKALKETNVKLFPVNTLLIAMYGEGKTRGQVGRMKINATTNQACAALVNSNIDYVLNEYVFYYCLSKYNELRRLAVGGNQPNLNLEKIKMWEIDIPPLEEQTEIVRRVKLAFEKLDKIESRYRKAKEYFDKLTQSILNKAFRGELVPQDPNDKPIEIEV